MAGRVEGIAQPGDAAVHHVRGCYHIDAGLRFAQRLAAEHFDGLVVQDPLAGKKPVMAMGRIGIERDVADDAEAGQGLLHGPDGAVAEIVRPAGFGAVLALQRRRHHREDRDRRHAELGRLARGIDQRLDGEALDTGHAGQRLARRATFLNEDRPDEVRRVQAVLGHQTADPVMAAIAPEAQARIVTDMGDIARRRTSAGVFMISRHGVRSLARGQVSAKPRRGRGSAICGRR